MISRLLGAALLVFAPLLALPAQAADAGFARQVDAYLAPLLRTNNFSGTVLVARGDEVVFHKGYGQASIEHGVRNTPATVFQIASVSKPFTSAAIMLLKDQGKLDLRAPLSAVLPGYPGADKLTIHHLLTHTSGIPNINDFDDYDEIQRRPHSPASLVALFKDKPLEFEPGTRYGYSNSNYNLLALIVEKVSGREYEPSSRTRSSRNWTFGAPGITAGPHRSYRTQRRAMRLPARLALSAPRTWIGA